MYEKADYGRREDMFGSVLVQRRGWKLGKILLGCKEALICGETINASIQP